MNTVRSAPRVRVVGHVCVDLTPALTAPPSSTPGDLANVGALTVTAGGCVANTGGALTELGIAVSASADVGNDELAAVQRALLAERGLDVSGFRTTDSSTSYSIVIQTPGTDRTFWHHTGANDRFDGSGVDLGGVDLLHVGYPSLLPALVAEQGGPFVALLERAHAAGIATSVDLAVVGSPTDDSRAAWRDLLARVLPHTDILTPSVDDLRSALGPAFVDEGSVLTAASKLVALGAAIVAVSDGPRGFAVATAARERFAAAGGALAALDDSWFGRTLTLAASPVDVATTSTGAGDAATAGLLAALLRGAPLEAALRYAADVAAARVAGRPLGAVAPGW